MKTYVYLLALTALILAGAVGTVMLRLQKVQEKIMELTVSGGFWARMEKFEFYENGSIIYRDLTRNIKNSTSIPHSTLMELIGRMKLLLEAYPEGLKLEPMGGADYFTYNLSIYSNGRTTTYYWTDVSEEQPEELSYLASLLHGMNSFAAGYWKIVFYLKTEKLAFNKGETLKMFAVAINPSRSDFQYASPTPCHPDFRIQLRTPSGETVELFPVGYDPKKPCIQVVQNRTLKPGDTIQLEYNYTFSEEGTYVVEAYFPYAEWSATRYVSMLMITVHRF
jgi:hypothetical protein